MREPNPLHPGIVDQLEIGPICHPIAIGVDRIVSGAAKDTAASISKAWSRKALGAMFLTEQ